MVRGGYPPFGVVSAVRSMDINSGDDVSESSAWVSQHPAPPALPWGALPYGEGMEWTRMAALKVTYLTGAPFVLEVGCQERASLGLLVDIQLP